MYYSLSPYSLLKIAITRAFLILFGVVILGCKNTPVIEKPVVKENVIYQDSTVYFANKTASISLRASLLNTIPSNKESNHPLVIQPLTKGYQLQFRSINKENISISQASIVAGGKKITISDAAFFIPYNQGITLSLSLEDTQYISQQSDAVLRFKYNNHSVIITLSNHTIKEFSIDGA